MDFLSSRISGYNRSDLTAADVRYLNRYWIDFDQCVTNWKAVVDSAFAFSPGGNVSISRGYLVDAMQGGLLFDQSEFVSFAERLKESGENRFSVIEDVGTGSDWNLGNMAFFRFSYPSDVAWDEMVNSCSLAKDIFFRPIRCFFIVSNRALIGKYVDNDAETPYELRFHRAVGREKRSESGY